ncbi:uncharacterized protein K02A2.6-like [Patiria miniata]|uniref:Reverse transcriptase n=1 Tax=Patiria miniata TaxID=46514 RepID=A0A914B9G6_PATMI|nr:uncharacterized protein K02A2.6-like [Patiria miniata]
MNYSQTTHKTTQGGCCKECERHGHRGDKPVNRVTSHYKRNQKWQKPRSSQPRKHCDRCGLNNHNRDDCRYKSATCYKCKKVGHLQSECKSDSKSGPAPPTTKYTPQQRTKPKGRVRYVGDDENARELYDPTDDAYRDDSTFVDSVFTVTTSDKSKADTSGDTTADTYSRTSTIKVPVKIANIPIQMELDTGAAASIMSQSDYHKYLGHIPMQPVNRVLHAYAGAQLRILGQLVVEVQYGDQKATLPLIIVHADKYAPPLLGREWLTVLKLDWPNLFSQGQYGVKSDPIAELKSEYKDIFQPELGTVRGVKATLHVKEDAIPVFHKARTVPLALRPAVEKELARMEQETIIYPVDFSEWATPLVCVPKADGTVRLCGDYKNTVNKSIHTDQYPIPTSEEVFSKLAGGKKFSKIDLKCAYQQMLLDDKSQEYVTINTHKGLYRYTRLPFGISSSPAIWQRFIKQVLAGLDSTCAIMDDVLVTGKTDEEHLCNVKNVFQRFRKYGLRLKTEKCRFMQESVIYMGRRISAKGIQPTDDKVDAIRNAPVPQNVTELRSWLGMVNFQAQFLPNLSTMAHPLNELLGDCPWQWTDECTRAFEAVKDAISSDKLLAHYDPALPLEFATDASPYGLGAVMLHVYADGARHPIAYASRSLNKHEKGYAQLDKEALAIMFGLKRFRTYLYGRKFTIRTDHKPLERILGPKTSIPTLAAQRLQRWAVMLSAFDYDLQFIPSSQNVLADALSRLPLPTMEEDDEDAIYNIEDKRLDSLPVTSKEISHATRTDPVLSRVLEFTKSGWPAEVRDERLKPFFNRRHELSTEQDCLLWGLRVVIPYKYEKFILGELHDAHPGIVRMKEIARSYVWWPNIDRDIEQTVRLCASCQQTRHLPAVAPLMPWVWPSSSWHRIHIDFAQKDGHDFLIVIDAYAKWPEIFHMSSTTANATITVLRDLFSRYGIPYQLVSDNGPQFTSEEFQRLLKVNGVKHVRVAPYHAASNGAAERMVQSFKRALSSSKSSGRSLQQRIDSFLLTYRTTTHATTGRTPASLFLGRELRTRLSLLRPDVERKVVNMQSNQKLHHDKQTQLREFYAGEDVLVKDFRRKETWWLATVAERTAPKSYVVILQDGRVWKRHVDQMRRAERSTTSQSQNSRNGMHTSAHQDTDMSDLASIPVFIPTAETAPVVGSQIPQTERTHAPPSNVTNGEQTSQSATPTVTAGSSASPKPLRRSSRVSKPPDRLIETME